MKTAEEMKKMSESSAKRKERYAKQAYWKKRQKEDAEFEKYGKEQVKELKKTLPALIETAARKGKHSIEISMWWDYLVNYRRCEQKAMAQYIKSLEEAGYEVWFATKKGWSDGDGNYERDKNEMVIKWK